VKIGQPLWSFQASYSVDDLDISEDGSYLTFCVSDCVVLMDGDGNLLWTQDLDDPACDAALSSDGSYVVVGECTASGHDVYLFDRNGNELWRYDIQGWVGDVAISVDGSCVVAVGLWGLFIFDRSGNPMIESVRWLGGQLAITDDGEFVAATLENEDRLYLYNRQGRELWCYDEYVGDFSMTSDGRLIAVLANGDLALLDGIGSVLWSHRPENKLYGVEISSEGSHIAAISWCSLYLFDENGEELWSYEIDGCDSERKITSMAISSDGNIVAAGDSWGYFYLFDGQGDLLWEYNYKSIVPHHAETMVFSSDGRYLAIGCRDGTIHLFETGVGTQHPEVPTTPDYSDSTGEIAHDGESSSSESEITESEMIEDEAIKGVSTESGEEEPEMAIAVVNIKNKDDDGIFVMLYIDDELRNTTSLSHWTQHVEYFTLPSGTHKFGIEWRDPGTYKDYNVTVTQDFEPGEMLKVNLEIAEHRATTAEVYVKNSYSEQLEMFLDIDGGSEDEKKVAPSSYMKYFGSYEVSPGSHTFEIYWEDPDTEQVYWTDATETFEEEDSKEIKLIAEKQGPALEVEVKPIFFVMEVGDKQHMDITITNTGDETAKQVDVILISKNTRVAELDKSSISIGDIKPGEAWIESSFLPQIEALKEGESTIEVKVRGKNLPEISKSIVVSVSESGSIFLKDADLGEPLEARPSSEFIEETFGPSADESDMWENAEDYITDVYSSEVLDAVLSVQSSSKAGHAVEGETIKITLELLNKDTVPIAVAMAILPPSQLVFKYDEGEYTATTQKIKQPIESITSSPKDNVILYLRDLPAFVLDETLETGEEWLWHALHDPVQFREEGSGLIVEPNQMLIFTAEITPEEAGWLDISGEIYYTKEPIIKYTTEAQLTTFAIETKSVEFDPDNVEHIALRKSILVEEKECSLWGLVCW
jgi:outer membrane protein assembly factor BamB